MRCAKAALLPSAASSGPMRYAADRALTPSHARVKFRLMEGEMLKGHLDMIVLAALADGPAHGYAVIQEIHRRSGGAFDLPEGTIYPALHRLEQSGLLNSRWTTGESARQRRVYSLTRGGRRALADQRAVWQRFTDAIGGLLGAAGNATARSNR